MVDLLIVPFGKDVSVSVVTTSGGANLIVCPQTKVQNLISLDPGVKVIVLWVNINGSLVSSNHEILALSLRFTWCIHVFWRDLERWLNWNLLAKLFSSGGLGPYFAIRSILRQGNVPLRRSIWALVLNSWLNPLLLHVIYEILVLRSNCLLWVCPHHFGSMPWSAGDWRNVYRFLHYVFYHLLVHVLLGVRKLCHWLKLVIMKIKSLLFRVFGAKGRFQNFMARSLFNCDYHVGWASSGVLSAGVYRRIIGTILRSPNEVLLVY